jgi:hypothetical protein
MKKLLTVAFFSVFVANACFVAGNRQETSDNPKKTDQTNAQNLSSGAKSAENKTSNDAKQDDSKKNESAKAECLKTKVDGKKIDEKQTFAFDFEPFKGGCFITAHDPEFDDPALDSHFYIYQNGKETFDFPNQFNGIQGGCWIEAVAFEDLNEDDLTDIVIVGLCSAKSAPYNENMVYVNKGDRFTTNEEANYTLEKFKKVKEIKDFVKKNKEQFFQ